MTSTSVYLTALPPLLVRSLQSAWVSHGWPPVFTRCLPDGVGVPVSLPSPPLVSVGRNLLAFNDPRGTTSTADISQGRGCCSCLCQECAYWPPCHQYSHQKKGAPAINTSSNTSSSSTITDSVILCPFISSQKSCRNSFGFYWIFIRLSLARDSG